MNPDGEGPSDHARFFRKRIPVLFFNSGLHEDYHRPSDDADIINYNGMKDIVNFAYQLLLDIANYNKTIKFKETKSENSNRNHGSVKFTLGIVPDVTGSKDGLLVEGVRSGGIGEKAGIKKGDIIIEINGKPVKNIQDYMSRLNELENGSTIHIKVRRGNEIKTLSTRIN
jgi:S1-C subfamily serine protease